MRGNAPKVLCLAGAASYEESARRLSARFCGPDTAHIIGGTSGASGRGGCHRGWDALNALNIFLHSVTLTYLVDVAENQFDNMEIF